MFHQLNLEFRESIKKKYVYFVGTFVLMNIPLVSVYKHICC